MLRGMIRNGQVFLSTARVKGWNQSHVYIVGLCINLTGPQQIGPNDSSNNK